MAWRDKLYNLKKAFASLDRAVTLAGERDLSELERQGLIQGFEFTHELCWKVMKAYTTYQGIGSPKGSRDSAKLSYSAGLIADGDVWMDMIVSRNLSTHTYQEAVAKELAVKITDLYHPAIEAFIHHMQALRDD
jgi:nucleotidyltransferase substrate binding protein (TIGR01987 family)